MSENAHQEFSKTMNQFIQRIIAMDRAEKFCYGVTLSQANTINTIYKKETLTMNELSLELGLAISTLTRINDVLVRDGIVCRNACINDRRKVNLCLTEKGKELAEKLQICSENFWSKIFEDLPDDKKHEISQNLILLNKAIEKTESTCCTKK